MRLKIPFGVTLLLWMVLSLSAWGMVRFTASLRWWVVLSEFDYRLSPFYLAITGAGWTVAGGVLIFGILSRKKWSYPAILPYLIGWLAVYWLERVFFQSPRANLLFSGILSLLFLAVTIVCALHRNTKIFLTRSEEYGQYK